MRDRDIIFTAKILCVIFTPFYLSLMGLIALFLFSYLNMLPWSYKLFVLALVYILTVRLPVFMINIYRRYEGKAFFELGAKERRMVPYVISIVSYFICYYLMNLMRIPHFMSSIVMAALVIQIVCAMVNLWWKISTHTAAIGGVGGAIAAFSAMFAYNPVWWLCGVILIAGIVGSSRMIMRQHSLGQVTGGFLVGVVVSFVTIIIV